MVKVQLFLGVLSFAFAVFCLIDAIGTAQPRNLPKWAWIVMILLFPLLGSIAWFVAGRPQPTPPPSAFPEYDRPGRMAPGDSSKDEAFLRDVRARAEEQRARYQAEQRRKQQEGRQEGQQEGEPEPGGTGA
ncbi:MAG: PLD nuclease N-terminal domain-containing protein [Actinomycetota bacterium]|nr:PLD nuclease N-terminal domain-containing protein [Actinomycetota bacterium]